MQHPDTAHPLLLVGALVAVIVFMSYLFRVGWVQRGIDHLIQRALERIGLVRVLDYELLLRIQSGYCVSEIEVMPDTPVVNKTLRESRPWDHGVVILAIKRGGETIPGLPGPTQKLLVGDLLVVYGEEHKVRAVLQQAPPAA